MIVKTAFSALAAGVAALVLLAPAAGAKPRICGAKNIEGLLINLGKLTPNDVKHDMRVDVVRCGDVTGDGRADALFTISSGGTAGDIRFGVVKAGSEDGLVLYKPGYKVGIARVNSRAFEILQPHYGANDPNCCPSSFRVTRYTWTGSRFKAGAARKLKHAPARFYKS
jgi:hypothetical protein